MAFPTIDEACCTMWFLLLASFVDARAEEPDPEHPDTSRPVDGSDAPSAPDLAALEAALAADSGARSAAADRGGGARQSMNPDLSFITDVALAVFSGEPRQAGAHDPVANGFNLQQLELSVGSAVDPYLRFDANLVFSLFGVEIEEAYATTLSLPARLQVRAGQFLTSFGRLNATHPHSWDFVDQPLMHGRVFGGEGNRGLGVEGSVLLPLPWYVEVVASETAAGGEGTAKSFYGGDDLGVWSPLHLQTTVDVEQFFPIGPNWSLMVGTSWAGGPNPTGRRNRSDVLGADVFVKYRPVTVGSYTELKLQSEWAWRRYQVPDDILQDLTGYASVAWRFSRRWGAAARYERGTATWRLDSDRVADPVDPDWGTGRSRVAGDATFWPTEFSRLRGQVAWDQPDQGEGGTLAAFLALEVVVGAHGAHTF